MKSIHSLVAAVLAAGLLTACWDDSDNVSVPTPPVAGTVPASATASSQAYSQFIASLAEDNLGEPLDIDNVQPPVSETEEPIDVS